LAKIPIPLPLERRHLIEKDIPAAQAVAIAQAYLDDDRVSEAIAFLVKGEATDELDALAKQFADAGDAFLVKQLLDASGRELDSTGWLAVAASAEAAGKEFYAEMARRHARSADES
jgi:hypothetical protein